MTEHFHTPRDLNVQIHKVASSVREKSSKNVDLLFFYQG